MRRREFITLLGAAAACPPEARAQQAGRPPTIANLGSGAADSDSSKTMIELLDAGLREAGLELGRDYVLESRWANSDSSRFPALAAELLALHPAAVIVSTNLAVTTVLKLSRSVPIVDPSLNAPVATGLVRSLSHPGGNVTGVSTMADELIFKSIELMREVLPLVHNVTIMFNPTNPSNPVMLEMVTHQFANKEPIIESVGVGSPADLNAAFAEVARQKPNALIVLTDNSLQGMADTIVARATAQRVPVFGSFTLAFARAGALVNYGRDQKEAYRGAARILKKILVEISPADIPVEQPTKFNLVINLQAAKALGIVIPGTVLAHADEVIE